MDDELKFSWTSMFFVTSASLVVFSFIIKVLEGTHSHLLLMVSSIAMGLGICSWVRIFVIQNARLNKRKKRTIP